MFLFFSVARSQEIGSWERAAENGPKIISAKALRESGPRVNVLPYQSSAFDTAGWLAAA